MTRDRTLATLADTVFDVVIVGGGVQGATLAREAATRGLTTALVERDRFGMATSAGTLRIIHGGFRYLQHMDLPRIRESVRERRAWLRIAPTHVTPLPCAAPVGAGLKQSRLALAGALVVNELLSLDRNTGLSPGQQVPRGHLAGPAECRTLFGDLVPGVDRAACWFDGVIDSPETVTRKILCAATIAGATISEGVACDGFLRKGEYVTGVRARDLATGTTFDLRGTLTINAAGPWVNELLKAIEGMSPLPYRCIFGMNAILKQRLPTDVAMGLASQDPESGQRRLLFFVPWQNTTVVGSYYREMIEGLEEPYCREADLERFMARVDAAVPGMTLTPDDVAQPLVGLLPAVPDRTRGEPDLMRHYLLVDHGTRDGVPGLISAVGVKYTTARDVAERAIDLASRSAGFTVRPSRTAHDPLPESADTQTAADDNARGRC